jgi:CubicO group peptidase (beta-lactamase class C family)
MHHNGQCERTPLFQQGVPERGRKTTRLRLSFLAGLRHAAALITLLLSAGCAIKPAGMATLPPAAAVETPISRVRETQSAVVTPAATPVVSVSALPATIAPGTHWPGSDWTEASPESHSMDAALLDAMLEDVPARAPYLSSLLVIRGGDIVLEEYFGSSGPDTRNEIYSCTKSFIATLAGIAFDRGDLTSLDQKVLDFFPGQIFANQDSAKADMTVEDLLTMTAGLDWTEGDTAYRKLYYSEDWVQFMLDLPMLEQPGTRFNYCSGCSHLLSAILEEATGMDTLEFARQTLFDPIQIGEVGWLEDSQGIPLGGWGLQLTPRQMARLGYLYLRGGEWEGRQVVSRAWVEAAVAPHEKVEEKLDYGYQWWVRPSIDGYAALGLGGQMIAVIPGRDLVVVFTSRQGEAEPLFQMIEDYILPSVR